MKKNIKRILDKTPLITIAINSDRNIIYYNNFAKQKFQVSIDELISERQAVEHLMK